MGTANQTLKLNQTPERLTMATKLTPLSQIAQMGTGCSIAATQFSVVRFIRSFFSKPNSPREWQFHLVEIDDNGFRSEAKFWNRDEQEVQGLVGQTIEVEAGLHQNKPKGLEVAEDNKGNAQLSISERCSIAFIDGGRTQPAPRQQATQQQRQQHPQQQTRQQAPQQRPQQRPQQQAQRPQQQQNYPLAVPGVTVGMAINNACDLLKETVEPHDLDAYLNSPRFSQDLWHTASDIIRISRMLEQGKFAAQVKDRAQDHTLHQQTQPVERQAPQSTHAPASQPAQRQEPAPATRAPAQTDDFGECPITDGTGLEGDDIPF